MPELFFFGVFLLIICFMLYVGWKLNGLYNEEVVDSHDWKMQGMYYYGPHSVPESVAWRRCIKCYAVQVHRGEYPYPDQSNCSWERWTAGDGSCQ